MAYGEACGGAMVVVGQCVGNHHGDACHEEDEGDMLFAVHPACWLVRKDRAKCGDMETSSGIKKGAESISKCNITK